MSQALASISGWPSARPPIAISRHTNLESLSGALAERPELWRHLETHTVADRHYVRLGRDPHLEAWLICWMPSQDTGLHDHDLSSGAVRVVRGRIAEERLVIGQPDLAVTEYRAGAGLPF